MVEDLYELPTGEVEIIAAVSPWEHVRLLGEDMVQTELILLGQSPAAAGGSGRYFGRRGDRDYCASTTPGSHYSHRHRTGATHRDSGPGRDY